MPELPEVETTRRGILPHLQGKTFSGAVVRQAKLRWPVPNDLAERLSGQAVTAVERRGKYLLIRLAHGSIIIHLGMSGSLRIVPAATPAMAHDHVDLLLGEQCLRLRDPRRFGAVLWTTAPPETHPLLASLGPEPLSDAFDGDYLYTASRGRQVNIKTFIMNAHVVVGVGNIYASESLFLAGIRPHRKAGKIARKRYQQLARAIREVLSAAIEQGGTTLQDFANVQGKPGYFAQQLNVYGRAGEACYRCDAPIQQITLGQRSSFFCPHCQT